MDLPHDRKQEDGTHRTRPSLPQPLPLEPQPFPALPQSQPPTSGCLLIQDLGSDLGDEAHDEWFWTLEDDSSGWNNAPNGGASQHPIP
jgi:hypothetical protein